MRLEDRRHMLPTVLQRMADIMLPALPTLWFWGPREILRMKTFQNWCILQMQDNIHCMCSANTVNSSESSVWVMNLKWQRSTPDLTTANTHSMPWCRYCFTALRVTAERWRVRSWEKLRNVGGKSVLNKGQHCPGKAQHTMKRRRLWNPQSWAQSLFHHHPCFVILRKLFSTAVLKYFSENGGSTA